MSSYGDQLLVDSSIAVLLAVGLGVAYGHGGFLSLCHATFFGVGAYSAALFPHGWRLTADFPGYRLASAPESRDPCYSRHLSERYAAS